MLHRIINWITNPFKKKSEESYEPSSAFPNFKVPEHVPLSEEAKNKIKADLIQAVKEFQEKKDLDTLPINRVSEKTLDTMVEMVKNDIKEQVEPVTEEVNVPAAPKVSKKSSKKIMSQSKKKNVKG